MEHGERVFDLLDPAVQDIHDLDLETARARVAANDATGVAAIRGSFALVGRDGITVRMARTLDRPMRFFLAKAAAGPMLVISDRIDAIREFLAARGMADQFHPTYTRMVPAHHIMEVQLRGCPDPAPATRRYFDPPRETLRPDLDEIAHTYTEALAGAIRNWLERIPREAPIGVAFSGGIDSGVVLLLVHHLLGELGMSRTRLKAFTLSIDGAGADLEQARRFLKEVGLEVYHEPVDMPASALDVQRTIALLEDYKPLDVQSGCAALALLSGIRARYPDWVHLIDGDGGDENLKDYPIEENPELTIRSVLSNPMLYQEGWGVGSLKHSSVYSGGQSRSYVRTYAPARALGFCGFSPYTTRAVIAAAEAIPFVSLTDWSVPALYRLKGEIAARGIRALTGLAMPVYEKRRFQHGALAEGRFASVFRGDETTYRRHFHSLYA